VAAATVFQDRGRGPVAAEIVVGAGEPSVKPPTAIITLPVGPVVVAIPRMEYLSVSEKGLY
jgi:hypothetical protein